MARRVEFRLSMPGVASWNGRWSGEGRNYTITRRLTERQIKMLGITPDSPGYWSYGWSDGWRAGVSARIVPAGERLRKSDGFCGYDWMVGTLCIYGEILDDAGVRARALATTGEEG